MAMYIFTCMVTIRTSGPPRPPGCIEIHSTPRSWSPSVLKQGQWRRGE